MQFNAPPSKEEMEYYQNLASEERSLSTYNFMSPKYSLSGVDIQKWGTNLGLFLAPVALIYLIAVITAINNNGVSLADFVPDTLTVGAIVLYVLNAGVDILRKFTAGPAV